MLTEVDVALALVFSILVWVKPDSSQLREALMLTGYQSDTSWLFHCSLTEGIRNYSDKSSTIQRRRI